METRQMTPLFYLLLCSNCLQHSFLYLKIVKIHFLVGPFGLFWSVKYFSFEQKLLIRTAHIFQPIFSAHRRPEVARNPYYVSKKRYQLLD